MARAVVAQARADFKAHRGKRTLKIYRQALKDRRNKTVRQNWRVKYDKRTTLLMEARMVRIARMALLNKRRDVVEAVKKRMAECPWEAEVEALRGPLTTQACSTRRWRLPPRAPRPRAPWAAWACTLQWGAP